MSSLAAPSPPPPTFAGLYRETVADLFAYVATLLGDRAAAEDVVAQAYERAYRKRRTYDPARGSERAWLFGIARNAALDELRRRRRVVPLVHDEGLPAPDEDRDTRATVRAAVAALPPRDRELVALKYHAGLANAEIARVLGLSESNVGTRLHRAMERLREACDG